MADRVSIARVARQAGVSIATVSRVVNGVANKARPETVARVQRAVAELGYRPASAGQALRSRQSRLVALLAANLANPAMTAIAASAEVALREAGLVMVLCDTHDRADLQDEYLLEMRAHQVRATVLLGAVESPGLAAAAAAGETLLFVGRAGPGDLAGRPFVGIDNARAGADVADFIVARGFRRPALIHGPLTSSATAARVAAIIDRLAREGRPLAPDAVASGQGLDHLVIGHEGMGRLLEAGGEAPDVVACTSDLIAFGAHRRAGEAGRDPSAVTFVGFDDNPLNPWVAPWLSSVRIPYDAFGRAITEALEGMRSAGARAATILPHDLRLRADMAEPRPPAGAPAS